MSFLKHIWIYGLLIEILMLGCKGFTDVSGTSASNTKLAVNKTTINSSNPAAKTVLTNLTKTTIANFSIASSTGQNILTWDNAAGAVNYKIYWGLNASSITNVISNVQSPYSHSGLTDGTEYYYQVAGFDTLAAEIARSNTALGIPGASAVLTVNSTYEENDLIWAGVAGATQYNVYWSTNPGVTKLSSVFSNSLAIFKHTSLIGGKQYYYRIGAVFGSMETLSNEIAATAKTVLGAVYGFSGESNSATTNTLYWQPLNGAVSYNLYWSVNPGVSSSSTKIAGATSPYTHTGRTSDVVYFYRIAGVDASGREGTLSGEQKAIAGGIIGPIGLNFGGRSVVNSLDGLRTYIGGNFAYAGRKNQTSGSVLDLVSGKPLVGGTSAPVINGTISAVVSDGNDGWYIGGSFTTVYGISRVNLAHIFSDSTVDPNWNPGTGINSSISTLALSGSKLYVGGSFVTIAGQSRNNIACLDLSGNATSWDPNANGQVQTLAVSGTTVYAGGSFTAIGGQTRNKIAALDSSLDTSNATTWDPNSNGPINVILPSGSTIYIGGSFTNIGGQLRNNIAALNAGVATNNATAWDPNAAGAVECLAISSTTIYAGGAFFGIGGQAWGGVVALNTTINTNNATGWHAFADSNVKSLIIVGTTIYAGGTFGYVGYDPGAAIQYGGGLAAFDLNLNNNNLLPWIARSIGGTYAIAYSNNKLFVGGSFSVIGSTQNRGHLVALDSSGNLTNWSPNADSDVYSLALSGTTLYASGQFLNIGGSPRNRIAALDTTLNVNNATSWNPNANSDVRAILKSGTTIYAGGSFSNIGGQARNFIAALDTTLNTNNATLWDPSANSFVKSLTNAGAYIYAGGDFTAIGGQARNRLAALLISSNTNNATAWNPNADATVEALVASGTTVYAGGQFANVGGQARAYIAALDTTINTNNATAWNPDLTLGYNVASIVKFGADIYASGLFIRASGLFHNGFVDLDANLNVNNAKNWGQNAGLAGSLAMNMSGARLYASNAVVVDYATGVPLTDCLFSDSFENFTNANQPAGWSSGISVVQDLVLGITHGIAAAAIDITGGNPNVSFSRVIPSNECKTLKFDMTSAGPEAYATVNGSEVWSSTATGLNFTVDLTSFVGDVNLALGARQGANGRVQFDNLRLTK